MKQHITKEQWEELDDNNKDIIWHHEDKQADEYLTIGKMIEFLGDNLDLWDDSQKNIWYVGKFENGIKRVFEKSELCDALWEAVKYKLKQ